MECLNQEVTRFLRAYRNQNQADWSRYLFWAEYTQNSLRKPATGLTMCMASNLPYSPGQGSPWNSWPLVTGSRVAREVWGQWRGASNQASVVTPAHHQRAPSAEY